MARGATVAPREEEERDVVIFVIFVAAYREPNADPPRAEADDDADADADDDADDDAPPQPRVELRHAEPQPPAAPPPPPPLLAALPPLPPFVVFNPSAVKAARLLVSLRHTPTQHTPTQHATTCCFWGSWRCCCWRRVERRCFDAAATAAADDGAAAAAHEVVISW